MSTANVAARALGARFGHVKMMLFDESTTDDSIDATFQSLSRPTFRRPIILVRSGLSSAVIRL
jgi:hypothetical protein